MTFITLGGNSERRSDCFELPYSARRDRPLADYVAERILEHREAAVPLQQQAVLCPGIKAHHSKSN